MEFLRTVGGEIVAFIARTLIRLLYRIEVKGSLPADPGRMLVISNHQSFLDGVILGAFLPISPTYLVHTTIASQWIFRIPPDVHPARRGGYDEPAIAENPDSADRKRQARGDLPGGANHVDREPHEDLRRPGVRRRAHGLPCGGGSSRRADPFTIQPDDR